MLVAAGAPLSHRAQWCLRGQSYCNWWSVLQLLHQWWSQLLQPCATVLSGDRLASLAVVVVSMVVTAMHPCADVLSGACFVTQFCLAIAGGIRARQTSLTCHFLRWVGQVLLVGCGLVLRLALWACCLPGQPHLPSVFGVGWHLPGAAAWLYNRCLVVLPGWSVPHPLLCGGCYTQSSASICVDMHKYCVWAQIEASGCEYGPDVPGGFFVWALYHLHGSMSQGCGEVVGDLRVQVAAVAAALLSRVWPANFLFVPLWRGAHAVVSQFLRP